MLTLLHITSYLIQGFELWFSVNKPMAPHWALLRASMLNKMIHTVASRIHHVSPTCRDASEKGLGEGCFLVEPELWRYKSHAKDSSLNFRFSWSLYITVYRCIQYLKQCKEKHQWHLLTMGFLGVPLTIFHRPSVLEISNKVSMEEKTLSKSWPPETAGCFGSPNLEGSNFPSYKLVVWYLVLSVMYPFRWIPLSNFNGCHVNKAINQTESPFIPVSNRSSLQLYFHAIHCRW